MRRINNNKYASILNCWLQGAPFWLSFLTFMRNFECLHASYGCGYCHLFKIGKSFIEHFRNSRFFFFGEILPKNWQFITRSKKFIQLVKPCCCRISNFFDIFKCFKYIFYWKRIELYLWNALTISLENW